MSSSHAVTIRRAVPDDAEALAHLHVLVWEEAYTSLMPASVFEARRATLTDRIERWGENITGSPARTIVAADPSGLVGFASAGPARSDDVDVDDELWALYVRASRWGTGVGHALLTDSLGDRPACLWVLRGNDRAITFYGRHGFVADGTARSDEYGTELRMVRTTPGLGPSRTP
ncbi:ribosomal protein S18 acetylase RimI-like enzyme [Humibacillus xanthopallidus]|uniref:Ribosomal protein S18 acetylase RimI-like enzyme n=1 Tax=Humibacillus xanthopallidus TaxID=412689 RepID=A0A543PT60_9MICO|nr:GNAT family N-acetyltransferase [Humibacillus xanthopallidus]TQN47244.1 ribosomal protein S18 acetylase RimI-like enzyme [Humibacillus xanthopallidus]